jgi:DNA-binding transcriptional MerR regulator
MKHLYSIREFAKLSGVDSTTLRYWDEIGLFSPIKRNTENNYRFYSLEQILALNFVTTLSDLGIPLKIIAELRKERDPENLLLVLEKRERELDMELRLLRLRSSIIHARQELNRSGLKIEETQISVSSLEDKDLILWPNNEYKAGDTFLAPLAAFIEQAADHFVNLSFPVGGYWDSFSDFLLEPSRPGRFFSIDPVGTYKRKAGDYLIGYTRGYYAEMGNLSQRMSVYAEQNSIPVTGPVFTTYLHDETCTHDPTRYLAQSCVSVAQPSRLSSK